MFIVTGGAGFIGSAMVWHLNRMGITDIIIVDNLHTSTKWKNLVNLKFTDYYHKDDFLDFLELNQFDQPIEGIFHLGACSATTEKDADYLMENNYRYTKILADWALSKKIRFIYASSAATYGNGSLGFNDHDEIIDQLKPLNMYGYSKHLFDLTAKKLGWTDKIVGIKFFNVYGPNEYHKGDMASVIYKSFHQINQLGHVNLFKSYIPDYKDGEQVRDFIYVKDCVKVLWWLYQQQQVNGVFNLGTGKARTWVDLVSSTFSAMNKSKDIRFIDMPDHLINAYQYHTEANMNKLISAGYKEPFYSLEEGIKDYVQHYLLSDDAHLS